MKKLSLSMQMGLIALLSVIGMLVITFSNKLTMLHLNDLNKSRLELSYLQQDILALKSFQRSFSTYKKIEYAEQFNETYVEIEKDLAGFNEVMADTQQISALNSKLLKAINLYHQNFTRYIEMAIQIGLDHKSGLYGKLRSAVHEAETLLKAQNNEKLAKNMLQLRRREKDFMLRLDAKYVDKFEQDFQVFKQSLNASNLPRKSISTISNAMNVYRQNFYNLVKISEQIGLNKNSGNA